MPGDPLAPMEFDCSSSASATATMLVNKWSHPDSALKDPATTAPSAATEIDLYLISEEDAHYEQDILKDRCSSLNSWLRYLEYKVKTGSIHGQVFVFERACKALPRSYKLWKMVCASWSFPRFTYCFYLFFCSGIVCCVEMVLVV